MSKRVIGVVRAYIDTIRPCIDTNNTIEDIAKSAVMNAKLNEVVEFLDQYENNKLSPEFIRFLQEKSE